MALHIEIKVTPQSGRSCCILDKNKKLKCFIKAAPEKGKANQELIELLAKALKVSKQKIEIVSGLTSRTKRIHIDHEITVDALMGALGIDLQKELF